MELVRHKGTYLTLSHFHQDIDLDSNEASNLLKTYCMFSEQYIAGTRTTCSTIVNVFEQEVMSICQDRTFMGIWQIFALSSLLHCRLFSVYPDLGSYLYRMTLNRIVPPIENRHDDVLAAVVWTSTRNDMEKRNWIPNHFVPLIPVSKPVDADISNLFDDIDIMMDTSLDSSIVDGILQSFKDDPFSETLTAGDDSDRSLDEVVHDARTAGTDVDDHSEESRLATSESYDRSLDEVVHDARTAGTDVDDHSEESRLATSESYDRYENLKLDNPLAHSNSQTAHPDNPATQPDNPMAHPNSTGIAASRFSVGTSISVQHGSDILKAVVVQSPDAQSSPEHGVWVQFYKKARKHLWSLEEKPFFVLWEDVIKHLDEPSLSMCGLRIYYKF